MVGFRTSVKRGVVLQGLPGRSGKSCLSQQARRRLLLRNVPYRLVRIAAKETAQASVATMPVAPSELTTGKDLELLNQNNYYEYLGNVGNDLVVVDFYTDWCGPCKMIYPELVKMAVEYKTQGVRFVKFKITKENKELGKALRVRVAPTFFLYKNSEKIAEMTGARVEQLRALVEEHRG